MVQIPLRISNAWLIPGSSPILIDTGSPGEEKKIEHILKRHGIALRQLALVVHTHAHLDHAGSSAVIKKQTGVPMLVQQEDNQNLQTGSNGVVKYRSFLGWAIKLAVFKPYPGVAADIIVADRFSLSEFGVAGEVIHTPGHTPGSCSVILENGEAVVGDLFMGGYLGGYVFGKKVCGYHYYINNREQLHQSIKRVLQTGAHTFYTGHGSPLKREVVLRKFGWLLSKNAG